MTIKYFLLTLFLFYFSFSSNPQTVRENYAVLFYNVENLFDLDDNPKTNDDEFTPDGDRYWTYNKLNNKLLNLSKVILSASGWNPPELVGLCEVENRKMLELLLSQTPLKELPYKIIHKESPDHRGIDVALLYNYEEFYPLEYKFFPLIHSGDSVQNTREILYVKGILNETDTLNLFINHWPSRYGGLMETRQKRMLAAQTLREIIDKLFEEEINPKVIIVGDFNDQPVDESIIRHLNTHNVSGNIERHKLYNLSVGWMNNEQGTLKYRSQWFVYDQIIVTGNLLKKDSHLKTSTKLATIINYPFLLENDERYGGLRPKRTYYGYTYNGGFSDHLPVLLRLKSGN